MNKINDTTTEIYDVIVIGGGPSGMMAAATAAANGARVLLLEKNDTLGKKLRITGGGRCNITNNEPDIRKLLPKYKSAEPFLYSAFARFNVSDTLKFFKGLGVETKVENEGRVFPVTDSADTVWQAMVGQLDSYNVKVITNVKVLDLLCDTDSKVISGVKAEVYSKNKVFYASKYIFALGGASRPETGSNGDGFTILSRIGHNIRKSDSSLVPLVTDLNWVHKLSGVSLSNISISILQNGKKIRNSNNNVMSRILFTHFGLSGPGILNISSKVKELLIGNNVEISLDLYPEKSVEYIDQHLMTTLSQNNKVIKNGLLESLQLISLGHVTAPIIDAILLNANIDENLISNSLARVARQRLVYVLKGLNIKVTGTLGKDKAIVTSGGVPLSEVDTRYMRSRLYNNLYIVGDMLDIDRPSGGYSLQLCWTTGFVAGVSAAE